MQIDNFSLLLGGLLGISLGSGLTALFFLKLLKLEMEEHLKQIDAFGKLSDEYHGLCDDYDEAISNGREAFESVHSRHMVTLNLIIDAVRRRDRGELFGFSEPLLEEVMDILRAKNEEFAAENEALAKKRETVQ